MAETVVTHSERWDMVIKPGEGETWPVIDVPGLTRGQRMQPDVIRVDLRRGATAPHVRLAGIRILRDGSEGQRRLVVAVNGSRAVGWVDEIIEHERAKCKLGPDATGVDW